MIASLEILPDTVTADELASAIDAAAARIAPTWPLDRMIAVNPWWGYVSQPIAAAGAELGALAGTRLLMPRSWYRAQLQAGRFSARHIAESLQLHRSRHTVDEVLQALDTDAAPPLVRQLVTDLADTERDLGHHMSWGEFVTRHLSQAAAACFDEGQARWTPERRGGLYGVWRELALHDRSPRLLMGMHDFRETVAELPGDPRELIALATNLFGIPADAREAWYTALLMTVHGWASACAFRRWEARLTGGDDDQIVHLLAARLAWEIILYRRGTPALAASWSTIRRGWSEALGNGQAGDQIDWILQRALELAYQEQLIDGLARPAATPIAQPTAQAVFCIDVRSEVFRRALEAAAPAVQTLGFAGFFGLPIAYRSPAGPARAQLPGLLAPGLIAEDATASEIAEPWRRALEQKAAWKNFATTPGSAFSFVEIAGLAHGAALVRDALGLGDTVLDPLRGVLGSKAGDTLRPEVSRRADGTPVPLEQRVRLAAGVLRAMSLSRGHARLVAVIGHGAGVTNNPQAAGLHCGACGGQTGEVNARALAALLNDPEVRVGLRGEGIDLAETTWVVPGLHNTTTDDVSLYDLDRVPASHRQEVVEFQRQLEEAGRRARAERAPALGLGGLRGEDLDRAIRRRATDWSEVRPEWGLARNAAFVVAPRERTRGLDLEGRSFLHEYRWQDDRGFGVLELIMTAPMVVTHWINMQYYASTVDPHRYGSGNKVLHNVVGGRLGVFEGAGGDLRFGLAHQSVHDGNDFYHEPLRLSVVIEAPAEAMDAIIAKHPVVRHLVDNEWIFLYRIDGASSGIQQRRADGWHAVPSGRGRSGVGAN